MGGYYLAYLKVNKDSREAKEIVAKQLEVLESAMREGCIGQLPEIYDGEIPVSSKGCFAQAWSVGKSCVFMKNWRNNKMEFTGVYHKTSEQMSYPLDEDRLIVNIKTGYDVKQVFIHYGDPYEAGILGGNENGQEKERKLFIKTSALSNLVDNNASSCI